MTHETALDYAVEELRSLQNTREPAQGRVRALTGDASGRLIGNRGTPWIFARLNGDASQLVEAYNGTPLVPGIDIAIILIVKYQQGRVALYEVERLANDVAYANYNPSNQGGQGLHHESHEFRPDGTGAWDGVYSYPRARTDLRLSAYDPPTLHLYVFPGWYRIGSTMYRYEGGDIGPFTPPGSGIEYDAVFIDATGAFTIVPNALIAGTPFTVALISNNAPLGLVQLTFGQTAIDENDLVQDLRYIVEDTGSGGGGGSTATALAVMRWVAASGQTNFVLPDTAVLLLTVSTNGLVDDPLGYNLSADGTELIFDAMRSSTDIIVATYQVAIT